VLVQRAAVEGARATSRVLTEAAEGAALTGVHAAGAGAGVGTSSSPHTMPALHALGPSEVAATAEAFLGRLWSSAVPVSDDTAGMVLQVKERALREWTRELVGGVLGRCEVAVGAEREGAARREAALAGALVGLYKFNPADP
jgi:hypothetical protein